MPLRSWRIYELDPDARSEACDLLGPHKPLFDFVNGIWYCWDVSPNGDELVYSAVNDKTDRNHKSINLDIYKFALDKTYAEPKSISHREENGKKKDHDDFRPSYSPDGKLIVYAAKQVSALRGDYPRLTLYERPIDENSLESLGLSLYLPKTRWIGTCRSIGCSRATNFL